MNKKQLIHIVSTITNLKKQDVDLVITSALEVIIISISKREPVRLVGFGSFRLYQKRSNLPSKNSVRTSTYAKAVKFSIGKFFKQTLFSVT
jgi:nucleoid DNA-binding protein